MLFSLGEQCVNNFVDRDAPEHDFKVPIDLELCNDCGLVQMKHTAPQEILYARKYWYRSGVTLMMRNALRDITREIERTVPLDPGDIVLDIGSNDGTLLRTYSSEDVVRIGVEPASNLAEDGRRGLDVHIEDFWSAGEFFKQTKHLPYEGPPRAKVITAIGMFYDLEDPNQFIADVSTVLRRDGVFVAQLMCLKNMLNVNDLGNFAHEHLEFYSIRSLDKLFEQHGLEIFDIEKNYVNGESYRLWVRHIGSSVEADQYAQHRLKTVRENDEGLDDPDVLNTFFWKLNENKRRLKGFITTAKAAGKSIWVYGASTKGNTILQFCDLDHTLIDGAVDKSPEKWGKYTVGTKIYICSNEQGRAAKPDYFLVLPYAFLSEFEDIEKEWRQNGGKFIIPLPEFKVI